MGVEIEQYKKGGNGTPDCYLVKSGETILGLLEKYKNTSVETHPWKAFLGHGQSVQYIGPFYGRGGKQDAIDAIMNHNI